MIRPILLGFFSVVLLVALGAGFWWFDSEVLAPKRALTKEAEAEETVPPPEEPSLAVWRQLAAEAGSRSPVENIGVLRAFFAAHPESPAAPAAFELLNTHSAKLLFTDLPAPWKKSYSVVSGDSLARVSSREKSPMEWIMKVNNLLTHDLQIGQQLLIPQLEIRIVADRPAGRLEVHDADGLLLSFPMFDSETPPGLAGETTVRERIVTAEGNRVAFGDPRYADGEKTISLAAGTNLAATPPAAPEGETLAMSRGLLLDPADFHELFLIVRPGTPVEVR